MPSGVPHQHAADLRLYGLLKNSRSVSGHRFSDAVSALQNQCRLSEAAEKLAFRAAAPEGVID
jgi:hypothetical protein